MALACRSRLGPLDDGESSEAGLVMTLWRRALFDREWLDLAISLSRPFVVRFDFDDAALPDDIVREVADLPGALPLL